MSITFAFASRSLRTTMRIGCTRLPDPSSSWARKMAPNYLVKADVKLAPKFPLVRAWKLSDRSRMMWIRGNTEKSDRLRDETCWRGYIRRSPLSGLAYGGLIDRSTARYFYKGSKTSLHKHTGNLVENLFYKKCVFKNYLQLLTEKFLSQTTTTL